MIPPTFLLGGTMNWYVVDKNYINYLVKVDKRVGYVEYGGRLKLHIGILVTVNYLNYYVPISSAKSKHHNMSNSIDFHKLIDEVTGELYAVININNMIPVPDFCITQLKYDKIANFRTFLNEKEKTDYIYLLQKEKLIIDKIIIEKLKKQTKETGRIVLMVSIIEKKKKEK